MEAIVGSANSHSALVAGASTAVDKISLRALDATIQLIFKPLSITRGDVLQISAGPCQQSELNIDRGVNRNWKDGGLLFSPPFR